MTPSTAVAPPLDSAKAFDVLLASEGNLDMACEILGTPASPAPKAAVVKALMDSPQDQLSKALRVFSLLESHDLRRKVKLIAEATLADLDGEAAFKVYVDLSDQVQELTKPQQQGPAGGNVFQFIFDNLPREASMAIKGLARLDPQAREELRRIAASKDVSPTAADDDGAASPRALPSPAASARPDEERGITGQVIEGRVA